MKPATVELFCESCGLTAELPLSPAELRAVHCEGCGREMFFQMEEVADEPAEIELAGLGSSA